MLPALTAAQMAEVDRLMVEEYGILLIQMMENAGRNLAEQARRMLGSSVIGRKIMVLCGSGNNGGGGLVAARHLANWGADIQVRLVSDPARLKDVPAHQLQILQAMGFSGAIQPVEHVEIPDLIVDAMIGYGLRAEPQGLVADWIRWVNNTECPVLALDTPSGLDVTTGIPGNPCVQAIATLTLALPKTGLLRSQARRFVGDLYLADIGVPPSLYKRLSIDIGPIFVYDSIIPITEGGTNGPAAEHF